MSIRVYISGAAPEIGGRDRGYRGGEFESFAGPEEETVPLGSGLPRGLDSDVGLAVIIEVPDRQSVFQTVIGGIGLVSRPVGESLVEKERPAFIRGHLDPAYPLGTAVGSQQESVDILGKEGVGGSTAGERRRKEQRSKQSRNCNRDRTPQHSVIPPRFRFQYPLLYIEPAQ